MENFHYIRSIQRRQEPLGFYSGLHMSGDEEPP